MYKYNLLLYKKIDFIFGSIRLVYTITMPEQIIAGSTVPLSNTDSTVPLSNTDSTVPLSNTGSDIQVSIAVSDIQVSIAGSAVPMFNPGSAVPMFNPGSPMPKLVQAGSHRQKLPEAGSHRQKLPEAGLHRQKLPEAGLHMQKSTITHPSCLAPDGCHLFEAQLDYSRITGHVGVIDKKLVPLQDDVWRLKQQLPDLQKNFRVYEGCLSDLLRTQQLLEAKLQQQEEKLLHQEEKLKHQEELIKQLQEKSQ